MFLFRQIIQPLQQIISFKTMEIEISENITFIKSTTNEVALFLEKITRQHNSYKHTNLIIDISTIKKLTKGEITILNKLSDQHKKEKKSFVVVVNESFDFNQTTGNVMFVPTLQEAHDIVDIEEIERDLGF